MSLFDPRLWLGIALFLVTTQGAGTLIGPTQTLNQYSYQETGCAYSFEEQSETFSVFNAKVTGSLRLHGGAYENYQGVVISGTGNRVLGNRIQTLLPGQAFRLPSGAFLTRTGRTPFQVRIIGYALIFPSRVNCR